MGNSLAADAERRATHNDPRLGVIFDLDGVLIDSEGLQYKSYSIILERWGVRVSRAEYAEHWIAGGRGPEHAVATYELPITPRQLRELKAPVYHEILRAEVTAMPAARDALARLSADFAVALATNSNQIDVDFVLDRFELRQFFTAVVARESYTRAKPEPDAFTTAAAALSLASAQCVVIEDAYKGLLAAVAAGSPCIAVPNEWTATNDFRKAARVVSSLDDIDAPLVRAILTPPQ